MEIAAGNDGIVREDQRIVGDGIRLDFERPGDRTQKIEACTIDLRLTADAIGVLHALVAFDMALADDGVFQQGAKRSRGIDLALGGRAACGYRGETAPTSPWRRPSTWRR